MAEGVSQEYTHIVLGAGTAGCVVAHRLSSSPANSVLVLEAGPRFSHWPASLPVGNYRHWLLRDFWRYETDPQDPGVKIANEIIGARVTGGGSSMNASFFVRGNPIAYDRWEEYGGPSWKFAGLLPYFKRIERYRGSPSPFRGQDGPISVLQAADASPMAEAWAKACEAHGLKRLEDYNGDEQVGISRMQLANLRPGLRHSAAEAYLDPIIDRPNLALRTRTMVLSIGIVGNRASSVTFRARDGSERTARASREVILSLGALRSPHVLMNSGVGPADALRAVGVTPIIDLPGVGRNLCDHGGAPIYFRKRLRSRASWPQLPWELTKWVVAHRGWFRRPYNPYVAFLAESGGDGIPFVEFIFSEHPLPLPQLRSKGLFGRVVDCGPNMISLRSRGEVRLRSSDPTDPPSVRLCCLTQAEDLRQCREALKAAREIAATSPLHDLLVEEAIPGKNCQTPGDLDDYTKRHFHTHWHYVGTCRLGRETDPMAVVDARLRVRGVDGLRIVDASVMPDTTCGNTMAPVLAIAEKAADMILGTDA